MLAVVLTFVPPLVAGWYAAGWVRPASSSRWMLLFRLSLSIGLALGFTSFSYFLWFVWGGRSAPVLLFAELTFFTLLSLLFWCLQFWNFASRPLLLPVPTHCLPRWIKIGWWLVIGCAVITAGVQGWRSPHGEIDAFAIWNLRARFLHRGGDDWHTAFNPLLPWSHPDYPLLLPTNVARCWTYAGSETTAVPRTISMLFAGGTVGLLVSGVAWLRTPSQGCLAGIVLLATPYFVELTTAQFADVPLSFYFLASVLLFEMYDRLDGKVFRLPLLAGLLAGMAAWTKNEGQLFLVATLAARGVTALGGGESWRVRLRELLAFTVGLAPFLCCLAFFKLSIVPGNDLVEGQSWSGMAQRFGTLERYRVVGKEVGEGLLRLGRSAGAVLPLYALLLGFAPKARRQSLHAAVVLVVMLVGYTLIYLITPHDVTWHVRFSVDRLLMQLWPTAKRCCCSFLRVAALGGTRTWYGQDFPRIASAAFLPAAPMTPPPGCAAAPHRYKPRIGVR